MIGDHTTSDSRLSHLDHIINRCSSLESLLLQLLLSDLAFERYLTLELLLSNLLTLRILTRVSQHFPCDRTYGSADCDAFRRFIILVSNDATDDCTSDSALDRFVADRLSVK